MIISLVERGGRARSIHVPSITANRIRNILVTNLSRQSFLMTGDSNVYTKLGKEYEGRDSLNHGKGEYGRGIIHTNTIEGFLSIFKRIMRGVYQHLSEEHLFRYLADFNFRYSNRALIEVSDRERAESTSLSIRWQEADLSTNW